jgi:PAS domain S-box-containing protein
MEKQMLISNTPWTWIKNLLSPPVFEDEEKTRIARILGIILWAIVAVVGALILIWLVTGRSDELGPYAFIANGVIVFVSIGLLFLIRRGNVKPAGLIFIIFLWINITFQAYTSDGVRGSVGIIYMTLMLLSSLLVDWKTSIVFAVLSIVFIWILAQVEILGFTTFQTPGPHEIAIEATGMFVLATIFLTLTTTGLSTALQRARKSEQSLKQSNQALQKNLEELARREDELRESEERFRVLFEHAPDPFFFLKTNGSLVVGNKAGQDFTGYRDEELQGQNLLDVGLISAEDLSKARIFLEKSQNGEPTGPSEVAMHHKDGQPLFAEVSTHPITLKGEQFVLGIARDITDRKKDEQERKRLEVQLQQSQKLEAIGTLAGGIAHDFNNILGAVMGYAELAMHEVDRASDPYQYLQEVLHAGRRAKGLVKQILTFSHQTEQEQTPVLVKLIIKEVVKMMRASLPATIAIRPNIESDALVMGDPTQIHQVIMNLCTNAGYAMQAEGGRLEVSLLEMQLDEESSVNYPNLKSGPYIKLTVADTGPGIQAHDLDRIFEPFFTTKEKGAGTGMGLAVVHGIVTSHGGDIFVRSEPGQGARFTVFLPALKKRVESVIRDHKPIPTGTERILFVDDEASLANAGRHMLESLGYDVVIRISSEEALELFNSRPDRFDLVVTDMTMPGLTGDRLARMMMQIRPDIPVILCTGFSTSITEEKALESGIRAFINKPVLKRQIGETIRKVLDDISGK